MVAYLYLDDGDPSESSSYAEWVVDTGQGLSINTLRPDEFGAQIRALEGMGGVPDGLILDLRLDQKGIRVAGQMKKANYRAPALAQEIRTRVAEGKMRDLPIVLWSFDRRLRDSYRLDHTSHDLFDLLVVKDKLMDQSFAAEVGRKLISLADGYREILVIYDGQTRGGDRRKRPKKQKICEILGFENADELAFLDPDIASHFERMSSRPTHDCARFIIRHLLDAPGPLIDRYELAARLGVDVDLSPDFEALIERCFAEAKYLGVFCGGWPRWWSFLILDCWNKLVDQESDLYSLDASERVQRLRKTTKLQRLCAAKPIHASYSSKFWTICQRLMLPIDPRDGLLLRAERRYRWESERFVSFEALSAREVNRSDIDPLDQGRIDSIAKIRTY